MRKWFVYMMKFKFKVIIYVLLIVFVAAMLLQISQVTIGNSPQKSDKTFSDSLLIPPNPNANVTVPVETDEDIGDLEVGTSVPDFASPPKDDFEMLP